MLAAPEFGIKLLAGPRKNIQVFKFIQKKLKKPTREQNIREKRGESMYDALYLGGISGKRRREL